MAATKIFLQEVQATVVVADVLAFHRLAESLDPAELGLALSGFYAHVAGVLERHGGRIVKFTGDGVLAAFLGGDHRGKALAGVAELDEARAGWVADNARVKLPPMDYSVGAASGQILAGELGTDRLRFWDVLGAPVNLAFRVCALAADRRLPQLLLADTVEGATSRPACLEVDPAEFDGKRQRLFRVEG